MVAHHEEIDSELPKELLAISHLLIRYEKYRVAGVYFLIRENKIAYIGQSSNVHIRVNEHRTMGYDKAFYIEVPAPKLKEIESAFISIFRPELNLSKNGQHTMCPQQSQQILNQNGYWPNQ